ncbi:MAG: GntR family transcriptional regulator [Verrucomicrobiae bacterium]|nr:GntR family transcriptional regulator [Verrucomicrobiae bacterium]
MKLPLDSAAPDPIYLQIERAIQRRIQQGVLPQFARLPSTDEMVKDWNVSRETVQKAMDGLVAKGLLERHRKRGTFVKNLQGQRIVAILAGSDLTEECRCFTRTLVGHLRTEIERDKDWGVRLYDGLNDLLAASEREKQGAWQNLKNDFQNYSFCGAIQLIGHRDALRLLLPQVDLPVVRYGPLLKDESADVILDMAHFGEEVVRFLDKCGVKQFVYLRVMFKFDQRQAPDLEGFKKGCRRFGLPQPEIVVAHPKDLTGALLERTAYEKTLQLIEQWTQTRRRPDFLVVSDDIAMRGVALALATRGIPISDAGAKPVRAKNGRGNNGLGVLTVANEGVEHHYGIPVLKYEFSPRKVATELIETLRAKIERKHSDFKLKKIPGRICGLASRKELLSSCKKSSSASLKILRDLGFTLVELLVVLSVLALLFAMMAPALKTARDAAKSAVCMGNLKNLGAALHIYAQDNDGRICPPWDGTHCWISLLSPKYIQNCDVAVCPSGDPARYVDTMKTYGFRAPTGASSFKYENCVVLADISEPAEFFILADSIFLNAASPNYLKQRYYFDADPNTPIDLRHAGKTKANTLMLDGSVQQRDASYFTNLFRFNNYVVTYKTH